jgi:hypothetical protein
MRRQRKFHLGCIASRKFQQFAVHLLGFEHSDCARRRTDISLHIDACRNVEVGLIDWALEQLYL